MSPRRERLRQLPKIDELLGLDEVARLSAPRWAVVEALRVEVERLRREILGDDSAADVGDDGDAGVKVDVARVEKHATALSQPQLRPVINATGVVLHTNLGRAPLAPAALDAAVKVAAGYSNLEYDLEAGARGSRHGHVTELLRALTGAEDAVVVNNNAGAVMLGLAALASGRAAVVSRGELVEIGGSFRIPDVMRLSGARLIEVGTTNRTRVADYAAVTDDDLALMLKVHRSNFAIVGFTEEASLAELAKLARDRGVHSMLDLGSGALLPRPAMRAMGLGAETTVAEAIATGVDLVCFSGDKLLGGPQAGVLAGRQTAIDAVRRHPLMRALRPDKLAIAALGATLALYRDDRAGEIPAVAMFGAAPEILRARADGLVARAGRLQSLALEIVDHDSAVGGGSLPLAKLSSLAVAVSGAAADRVDAALRAGDPPVVGRITRDRYHLDVRTLLGDGEIAAVADALRRIDRELAEVSP